MDTDPFVTVRTFLYPVEASVCLARLRSEGITCVLKDEFTAQVNPFYSNAIGGVKLQVRSSDAVRAAALIADAEYVEISDEDLTELKPESQEQGAPLCPACGSEEVSEPSLSKRAFAVSVLLLGFPLPFMNRKRHCYDCGKNF